MIRFSTGAAFVILILSTVFCSSSLAEDKIVDFLTRNEISMDELKTGNYGMRVSNVEVNSPADLGGLQVDDWILTLDGIAFHGDNEYTIIRFCNPEKKDYEFIIRRNGELKKLHIEDLLPVRRAGFNFYYRRGEFRKILDELHFPYDKTLWRPLHLFECRAAVELRKWLDQDPANKQNNRWFLEFYVLLRNMINQKYEKAKPLSKPAPVPFFNRLAKFYLSVAQHNLNPGNKPDWKKHGESLDFYVLYYPYPKHISPPMGKAELSDKEFEKYLAMELNSREEEEETLSNKAYNYANRGGYTTNAENYLGQVKAALINPDNHGGWPFRSPYVWYKDRRAVTVRELQVMLEKDDGDKALYALALLSPAIINRDEERVFELLDILNETSPYFTARAVNIAQSACNSWRAHELKEKIYTKAVELNVQMSPKPDPLYKMYLSKDLPGKWYVLRFPPEGFKSNPVGMKKLFGYNADGSLIEKKEEAPAINLAEEQEKRKLNIRALYDGCRMYYLSNDAKHPKKLSLLYPDYIADLATFSKYNVEIDKDSIDDKGGFSINTAITSESPGNTVFISEKPDEYSAELFVITAEGEITTKKNPDRNEEAVAALEVQKETPVKPEDKHDHYYYARFDDELPDLPEWTRTDTYLLPKFNERVLGRFAKDDVYLTLTDLPDHTYLQIEFKLYILTSMDGNHEKWGPDIWAAKMIEGPNLLFTTFSTWSAYQSYPVPFQYGHFRKHSAGMDVEFPIPWGRGEGQTWNEQTRYTMRFLIPHTKDSVKLVFSGVAMGGVGDESWALDDVKVHPLQQRPEFDITDLGMEAAWDALEGDDVKGLYYAQRTFTRAGEKGAQKLIRKLGWTEDAEMRQALESIAEVFKFDDRQQWEEALKMGKEFGPRAEPFIRYHIDKRRYSNNKPPWFDELTSAKVKNPRDHVHIHELKLPEKYVEARAAHILELIWTESARKALFLDKVE